MRSYGHGTTVLPFVKNKRQLTIPLCEGISFELFHEQLPLPVPCYALALVIEFTLGPYEMGHRVPSTSLTWRAVSTRLENVFTAAC